MNGPPALAQLTNAKVITNGMACPFCAYGVEKKLGQMKGVTDVTVDLKTSTASLTFEEGFSLDLAAIQKAVRRAGFTMGTVTISAIGSITDSDGNLFLEVRDSQQKFLLSEASETEGELHRGQNPQLLTPATEDALRKLMHGTAVIKVTGKIHEHQQSPVGMLIESYETVE